MNLSMLILAGINIYIDEVYNKVKFIVEKDIVLTSSQEEEVEKRVLRHKNGELKSYSWPEVKTRIKSGS